MKMLPKNRALNELEMQRFAEKLKIKHFRGVFMRDRLPKKAFLSECAVINLDSIHGPGSHWVAYCKQKNDVYYYDSFGNLPPPPELIEYFGSKSNIHFNYFTYQEYNTSICGQLCLTFLKNFNKHF